MADVLARFERVGITGAPGTGKSSLSRLVADRRVIHADESLIMPDGTRRAWSDIGPAVCGICPLDGPMLVEGTEVPQALRAGLQLDCLVVLTEPCEEQEPAHLHLWASMETVLAQVAEARPELPILYEAMPQDTQRYSVITLDSSNWEPTPQGGIRLKSVELSRADVYSYKRDGKVVREYRSPDGLRSPAAIASLEGATVTPSGHTFVTGETFRPLTLGHVQSVRWDDAAQALVGDIVVNDGPTVERIKRGELCEVSCGYANRFDDISGVSPSGKPYDRIQTEFIFNHVALGPEGWSRQGTAFTLDATDNQVQCPVGEETSMFKAKPTTDTEAKSVVAAPATGPAVSPSTDAVPTDAELSASAPSDPALAADPALVAQLVALLPDLQAMLADYRAYKADEAAELAAGELIGPAAQTTDAKDIESIVEATVKLRTEAVSIMGPKYTTAGKSNRQIRSDIVLSADSKFSIPSDDSALEAAYRMSLSVLSERARRTSHSTDQLRAFEIVTSTDSDDSGSREPVMDRVYESSRRQARAESAR